MKKNRIAVFEMICYVVAALLLVSAIYMLVANILYMNEYVAAYGMTFADLGSQAVQSLIGAFVPYFTYAFLTLAAGRIYHFVAVPKCVCEEPVAVEEVLELEAPVEALEAPAEEIAEEALEVPAEEAEAVEVVEAEPVVEETEETKEN